MRSRTPFHEGELHVQKLAGECDTAQRNGRIIQNNLAADASRFVAAQTHVILASVGGDESIWASVMIGTPGFVSAPDENTIEFDLTRAELGPDDPFWSNIDRDPRAALQLIDLTTRQRLRINGRIEHWTNERLHLAIDESYPNCPRYIQRRNVTSSVLAPAAGMPEVLHGDRLDADRQQLIGSADTLFVASAHPQRGVDASHRGGNPGFVELLDPKTLRIPDYIGNGMFNTLGNFVVNPHAGLLFVDFAHSCSLQLTGKAEIQWNLDDRADSTGGTHRYWDFHIDRWRQAPLARRITWQFVDFSPANPD